jgi:hypothetical protein
MWRSAPFFSHQLMNSDRAIPLTRSPKEPEMPSAKKVLFRPVALFPFLQCSLALPVLCALSIGLWSDNSWAQRSRTQFNPPPRQELQRPEPPSVSPTSPITFPATDASSPLGKALASCEPKADASELSLPATRGEIKLDRCYRGRDHLVCQFNALMEEANSLLANYRKIVDANYPEVRDVGGICTIKPAALANDLQNATEFENRFKAFKAEYEARSACANRIEQSLTQVAFPDMAQGASLVKSMTDAINGDVKGLSEVKGRLAEIAEKMALSHKAMGTLQKIHRAMCLAVQQ